MVDLAALRPVLVTGPAAVVSISDAKAHLRVDHSAEDTLIQGYLDAAIARLDGWTGILGRCVLTQTWRQDYAGFPASGVMRLPFPDVQSATVAYTNDEGEPQTLSAEVYSVVNDARGGVVLLRSGAFWPDTADAPDAVRITFVAGFTSVPPPIRAAILLHLGALYGHRAAVDAGTLAELPMAYDALVAPFRRVGI